MTDTIDITADNFEEQLDNWHANLRLAAEHLGVEAPEVTDKSMRATKARLFGGEERAEKLEKQSANGAREQFAECLHLTAAIAEAAGAPEEKVADYRTESESTKAFKHALGGK